MVGRVGAAVVVDDDDQPGRLRDRDVVERLPGHAAGQRPVADHRDDVPVLAADRVGLGQPVGVAQRGRRVASSRPRRARLGLARVAADPALAAQPVELAGPAGEHLVDVGLVAGVPDDPVARGVEGAVDGQGQLDHAEVGAEVPADRRARGHQQVADLGRQGLELVVGEPAEVARTGDLSSRPMDSESTDSESRRPRSRARAGCPARPGRRARGRRSPCGSRSSGRRRSWTSRPVSS